MLKRRIAPLLSLALLLIALVGCGGKTDNTAPGPVAMDQAEHDRWEIALVEMRIEKNEAFQDPARTALPRELIDGFEGLNYYFPNPDLRFQTTLVAAAGTDTVQLTKRRGETVPYILRGHVSFLAAGQTRTLQVFGPATPAHGDYLWLPFFDSSNTTDTYPGGRYLDIEVDTDGVVELDFNFAYNPLCDYNPEKYNCTLPPAGNTLDFAVAAGEKRFSTGH